MVLDICYMYLDGEVFASVSLSLKHTHNVSYFFLLVPPTYIYIKSIKLVIYEILFPDMCGTLKD
jgi:hypothetical protein